MPPLLLLLLLVRLLPCNRYINVSMEFNVLTLKPTYKLCWGSAGSSNALDIAQALGFDSRVLAEARILARSAAADQQQQPGSLAFQPVGAAVLQLLQQCMSHNSSSSSSMEYSLYVREVIEVKNHCPFAFL